MEYLVTWQIEIEADTARQAAQAALKVQRDPRSHATVFDVSDDSGDIVRVALMEEDEDSTCTCVGQHDGSCAFAEAAPSGVRNRIEILQWREVGDEEDGLTVAVYAADYEGDIRADVEVEEGGTFTWDDADNVDKALLSTNDFTILDGQTIQHGGRTFRIDITEVTA